MTWHDIIQSTNEVFFTLNVSTGVSNSCVYMCVSYLLFGWVEVFGSGLKEHFDLLALGDVDWQLNECLRVQKIRGNLVMTHWQVYKSQYTQKSARG